MTRHAAESAVRVREARRELKPRQTSDKFQFQTTALSFLRHSFRAYSPSLLALDSRRASQRAACGSEKSPPAIWA